MADSSNSHLPRTPFRAWQAFLWSLNGLKDTWRLESSFRLEVYLCTVLIPLGLYLGKNPVEKFLLVSVLLLVLIVEVLNSAIEAVVDRWGSEHHELAGRAKDMGSAAVFLADINVLICWALIMWPAISEEF
jgi:diacylglycerol kinase (ATP)